MTTSRDDRPFILLVENDELVRGMLTMLLTHRGYRTTSCDTVNEALRLITEERPAVVVSDINLNGSLTGLDLLETVRENSEMATLPVILMSGHYEVYRQKAEQLGVTAFLGKPFSNETLLRHIVAALQ